MTGPSREWITAVALLLLVLALRWPGVEQPLDNDSGAIAYHARLINAGEPLYGSHHPGHHTPGAYYVYALAFRALGDSPESVKILLVAWSFLLVWVTYRLGAAVVGRVAALWGAVACGVLQSHVRLLGQTGEIELFANLPRAVGCLLAIRWAAAGSGTVRWLWIGLTGAAALAFKPVYVAPLAVAALAALLAFVAARDRGREALGLLLRRWAWLGAGAAVGAGLTVSYFWSVGVLPNLWLVLTVGTEYVSYRSQSAPISAVLTLPLRGVWRASPGLLTAGLAGMALFRCRRAEGLHGWLPGTLLAAWFVVSLLEAGITRAEFRHYYLLLAPVTGLAAGLTLAETARRLRAWLGRAGGGVRWTAVVFAAGLILFSGYQRNAKLYRTYLRYKVGLRSYQEYVREGWYLGEHLLHLQEVVDYVRRSTAHDDRIYVWSGDMQIYTLARRRAATRFLWPIDVELAGGEAAVLAPSTELVLVGDHEYFDVPDWLTEGLAREFTLEAEIGAYRIHRRRRESPRP